MNQQQNADNSFASLYEKTLSRMEKLQPGQQVETTIVSISKDTIFLQLSGKSEGILDRAELTDADGKLTVKEGDTITVFFIQSKNGELCFTTKISGEKADPSMLENAYKNKIPVEGTVEKEIKGGYEIKIGSNRAFCPFSQMGLKHTKDNETCIGTHRTFMIQEYKEHGRNILVSNRAIEEQALQARLSTLKKTLQENQIITGTISSIQDYGAFVDIGGIQALLPVSEIARDRVDSIRSVLSEGQTIQAQIIKLDWAHERISISMKSLLSDPWTTAAEKYPKNSRHTGQVVRTTDFGVFVSLESGLDGLIHNSELRGAGKYNTTTETFKTGQKLSVQILEIDSDKKRIALKQASSDEEEAASQKYSSGEAETYNPFAALLSKKK